MVMVSGGKGAAALSIRTWRGSGFVLVWEVSLHVKLR
jgi:hypothetical protein